MSMSQVGSELPKVLAERYELSEQLASGRLTSVWRGHDRVLGRDVIVKVLHPHLAADPAIRARFHQEAVNAARLTHPNIVALYDTGELDDQGVAYVVMELVRGATLRQVLNTYGALPPAKAAQLACEITAALDYAHQHRVVHRNLKPTNVLLAEDGSVKVGDFSITAATAEEDPERTGELLDPAGYVAPEILAGQEPDGRADVYGLGACLYEMLTGRAPYASRSLSVHGTGQLFSPRAVRADVPRELDAVVRKAMALDPDRRFQSAREMASALARLAAAADSAPGMLAPAEAEHAMPPLADDAEVLAAEPEGFLRHEGRWLGWTLALVAMVAVLVVVGLIMSKSVNLNLHIPGVPSNKPSSNSSTTTGGQPSTIVRFTQATAFDPPPGDGSEHNGDAPKAIDGDPGTAWTTQSYTNPAFGNLKPGVGLILQTDRATQARELDLSLTSAGASFTVYGASGANPPSGFPGGWTRLGSITGAKQQTSLRLGGGGSYQYYLVWFTSPLPPGAGGGFQAGIAEASLRS
jgi:serine/threonine-protein kinase